MYVCKLGGKSTLIMYWRSGIFISNPIFLNVVIILLGVLTNTLETKIILDNYQPTYKRPDGGSYPFPGSPVPTSILKPLSNLLKAS